MFKKILGIWELMKEHKWKKYHFGEAGYRQFLDQTYV